MVLSNPNPTPKSNKKSFLEYLKDMSWMSKKSWAFQADTFGNSNLYRLSGIINQCRGNHTTTLLALKLLVRSAAAPGSTSCSKQKQKLFKKPLQTERVHNISLWSIGHCGTFSGCDEYEQLWSETDGQNLKGEDHRLHPEKSSSGCRVISDHAW
jgi:hypothetical protein